MKTATKLGLVFFGILIAGGLIVSAFSPKMPMLQLPPALQSATVQMPQAGGTDQIVSNPSSLPVLSDHMPLFEGITHWWNTPNDGPLTPDSLKGKVVLIDFWTYSCINCIRTYPFVKAMWSKYADKGLVIVGVHTPEFAFEADPNNVSREIAKNGILYPVALDPDFKTWNNYGNQYWPAEYLFDRQGRLRHTHFGEGEYDQSEAAIRDLLAESTTTDLGSMADIPTPDFSQIATPETYFGLNRGDAFMGTPGSVGASVNLHASDTANPNQWTAGGTWIFQSEYIENGTPGAVFRFNVQADMLHIVMESADHTDKNVDVYVDGIKAKDLKVNASTLYDVASFPKAGRHNVELRFPEAGVRLYAATFS